MSVPRDAAAGVAPTPVIFIFSWALLSVAGGYRWFGVGVDYPEYLKWWGTLNQWSSVTEGRFELLFAALGFAFRHLGFSLGTYYSVLVAIALGIKFTLIYRHTRSPLLALICYIPLFYLLHEYTQLRAAVAIAFGLLASFAYVRRSWWTAAVWLLLGATFQSSILALGFGFIVATSLSSIWAMLAFGLVVGAATAYLLNVDLVSLVVVLNPLIASYVATAQTYDPPNILSPQNILLVGAIVLAAGAALQDAHRAYRLHLVMCVLALVTFGLFYDVPAIGNRLFGLFFVFVVFLSFQSRRFDVASLAGVATLLSAAWSFRNAVEQRLIG